MAGTSVERRKRPKGEDADDGAEYEIDEGEWDKVSDDVAKDHDGGYATWSSTRPGASVPNKPR